MDRPKIVLDTNCLLQILGAKSRYHFLFSEFLVTTGSGHFVTVTKYPDPDVTYLQPKQIIKVNR